MLLVGLFCVRKEGGADLTKWLLVSRRSSLEKALGNLNDHIALLHVEKLL